MKSIPEIDFHGYTVIEVKHRLNSIWASHRWQGARRVKIIHGTGETLWKIVRGWADEKGIPWTVEVWNPGVTILLPCLRHKSSIDNFHRPLQGLKKHYPDKIEHKPASKIPKIPRSVSPVEKPGIIEFKAPELPDLMEEEMKRLENTGANIMHKRKYK
jgi:hypothetical protein